MLTCRLVVRDRNTRDRVSLGYEDRFLRRRVLRSDAGEAFLVDLKRPTSLDDGDAFQCEDGRRISVRALPEPLLEVTGDNLARLAWHIGNRHTPCQFAPGKLLIRRDPVLCDMLERLGADLRYVEAPFTPEGGAYGFGRTHGHQH